MALEGYDQYDISEYSFAQFVDFLFDRDVIPAPEYGDCKPEPWYWKTEVEFFVDAVIYDYTNLFSEPVFLFERFSRKQLEQGFWAIQSGCLDCSIDLIIWDERIDFENRANCVRSMYFLYEKFFSLDFLDSSAEMWWDSLAYNWHCGNRARVKGGEDLLMQDVMFETLEKILSLPSLKCQASALHGLGHLHHPSTTGTVDRYLNRNPNIDSGLRNYALAAARFEVL